MKVQYINHMGDDLSVVNAARVSFGKHKDLMDNSDAKLIHYLAKHNHKSPFNHAFATFHVKAPIFVARQLQKHEYMPWNEISRRYVDSEPEFYEPVVWRGRSEDKKQGSYGIVDLKTKPTHQYALQTYHNLLADGVAPEQARMVLPQSMYTEWYWSGSLYAFAKMCSLRLKEDTQLETQVIAKQISLEMETLFPISWRALI
jgi:thymidylate synthase (FAD)